MFSNIQIAIIRRKNLRRRKNNERCQRTQDGWSHHSKSFNLLQVAWDAIKMWSPLIQIIKIVPFYIWTNLLQAHCANSNLNYILVLPFYVLLDIFGEGICYCSKLRCYLRYKQNSNLFEQTWMCAHSYKLRK